MKQYLFFTFYFVIFNAVSQYHYQIKSNLLITNFNYSKSFNIGIETLNKHINSTLGYTTFSNYSETLNKISSKNGNFTKIILKKSNHNIGLEYGLNKMLNCVNKVKLIIGVKCLAGMYWNRFISEEYTLDSTKFGWKWKPQSYNNTNNYINSKGIASGIITYLSLETKLINRFYLYPEIILPLIMNFKKKEFDVYTNPGISFSLAYRFLKN